MRLAARYPFPRRFCLSILPLPHFMKILITGAAGFIGSHTSDRLLADGHEVLGIDNFRTGHWRNLESALWHDPRFALREADVAEAGVLDTVCAQFRPEAIIHLAALVSVQESIADPALNHRLNVEATEHVAAAAAKHGVRRVVFASSAAVYGDVRELPINEDAPKQPISPYGEAKLRSESILLDSPAVVAGNCIVRCQRYFNVFGPRQDPASPYSGVISIFQKCYAEGRAPTIYGDGRQTRDFVSVHDVARANALAATRPDVSSGVANICTGQATSLLDIVRIFSAQYPAVPLPTFASARSGDIVDSVGDPARACAELSFEAEWSVERTLGELIRCSHAA